MIDQDEEFAVRCESYAETCRLQLAALSKEVVPTEINNTTAQKPTFGVDLIHISDGLNASRYRDTVYSSNAKMLMALGMDHTEHDSSVNILDKKSVCNMALQHFFKQTKDIRENFAQEFEELLVDKLISKYDVMKSFVGDELFNRHLQGKGMK